MHEPAGTKSQRLERVEHEIVRELSELIREELKDPRVGFVTLIRSEVSPDLRTAKVFASPLGDRRQSSATIAGLQSAAGFLSVELGKRLRMRRTPTLTFIRDESIAQGVRMAHIIDEVQRRDEQRNQHDD
ncbi:MAG TPA: 30S ribosome-binding factor RbfA [Candidatus Eremiobacteraceae bacterium]|nr:30S ribosome-binding factor RbfA [Candidatus Eremiobacteraceae bacterium]